MTKQCRGTVTGVGQHGDADIAAVAAVLASPPRARMVLALGDGRALTATALATTAGVSPATASVHLAKLVEAGLLVVEERGRRRFYRVAGPWVGEIVETLARVAPAAPVRGLRADIRARALRRGRICLDHLAGQLGVALTAGLRERRVLAPAGEVVSRYGPAYLLTRWGAGALRDLGVEPAVLHPGAVQHHLDSSEQRPHLAGPLGAALLGRLLELGWIRPRPVPGAVALTGAGLSGLREALDLDVDRLGHLAPAGG